jgi:hypothetical protein
MMGAALIASHGLNPIWLAVVFAGQHLSNRLVGENLRHWVNGAAAGLFGHKRVGPQTK